MKEIIKKRAKKYFEERNFDNILTYSFHLLPDDEINFLEAYDEYLKKSNK